MKREPIELFMPPNMLKAKAGSGPGGLDMAAVKRAEQAMETLKSEFADWLADDVGVPASTAPASSAIASSGPEAVTRPLSKETAGRSL